MATAPTQMLEKIGRVLYGERWKRGTAKDGGVSEEIIRLWMNGEVELRPDNAVFAHLSIALNRRFAEIARLQRQVDHWINDDAYRNALLPQKKKAGAR